MSNGTTVTITGNLTRDPELRYTPSGTAVANMSVACNERVYDRDTQRYVDGDATFVVVTVWRDQAEHVAESLKQGQRAVVTGRLRLNQWEGRDGTRGQRLEMTADEVGVALRFGTAKYTPARGTGSGYGAPSGQQSTGWGAQPSDGWGDGPAADQAPF